MSVVLCRPHGSQSRSNVVQCGRDGAGGVHELMFVARAPRRFTLKRDQRQPAQGKDEEDQRS